MAEWSIEETEDGWYVTAGDSGIYLRCVDKDDAEKLVAMLLDMNVTVEQA
jgi:hypothetical protein